MYLQEVLTHSPAPTPASTVSSIQYLQYPISPASSIFGIQYPQHPGNQFQYPITGIQLQRPISSIQSIQLLVSYQAPYPVSGFQYPATYRRLSQVLRCWESGECVMRRWNLRSSKTNLYTPLKSQSSNSLSVGIWLIHLSVSGPWLVIYQSSVDRMWVCTA